MSSVLQIGQTLETDECGFEDDEAKTEWQAGVLSAERPALRAMCRRGRVGRESSVWWVVMNRFERYVQRAGENIFYRGVSLVQRTFWGGCIRTL